LTKNITFIERLFFPKLQNGDFLGSKNKINVAKPEKSKRRPNSRWIKTFFYRLKRVNDFFLKDCSNIMLRNSKWPKNASFYCCSIENKLLSGVKFQNGG
jgi:hypothetical protein